MNLTDNQKAYAGGVQVKPEQTVPAMNMKQQGILIESHAQRLAHKLGRPARDLAEMIRGSAARQTSDSPAARIEMAAAEVAGRITRGEA